MHNAWPTIWAEVNADAIARAGRTGDALFFMRAGFTGVQRACPLLWAGDQCVDFSRHDGLPSVICGALSSGLLGNAYHHSDIGGYTSLFGNVRTAELLQRWTEMAAFTPVMRTHEGNRPGDNLQIDQSPEVLAHFARFTRIWCHLAPYLRALSEQAATRGLPLQRPLFLEFPDDPAGYTIQDAYLYGPDLLVAPVHAAGLTNWCVHLPAGSAWTHVWSGIDLSRRRASHGARADRPAAGVLPRRLGVGGLVPAGKGCWLTSLCVVPSVAKQRYIHHEDTKARRSIGHRHLRVFAVIWLLERFHREWKTHPALSLRGASAKHPLPDEPVRSSGGIASSLRASQ